MHSTGTFSALALALSSSVLAAPLEVRQEPLIFDDTISFIAKTIGDNPNTTAFPDINNWRFVSRHDGASINDMVLLDPSSVSADDVPHFFRNGTDEPHGQGARLTTGTWKGFIWDLSVNNMTKDENDPNPGAYTALVELNIGEKDHNGTDGMDVNDEGKLITTQYVSDSFVACADEIVEGNSYIGVKALSRYDSKGRLGCWPIDLYAQCEGAISDENRADFPAFAKASCYANATSVVGSS